ncbi:MAG: thioredoxin family protein [Actinomycetota bacterium]
MTPTLQVPGLGLGERAPAFGGLPGADGRILGLASFEDAACVAVLFSGNACPTAKAWERELVRLQEDYPAFQLVVVNANNPYLSPPDTYAEMVRRAQAVGITYPYLKDTDGSVARAYGAVCTPHVFLLDHDRRVRYRGRLADSRRPETASRHDLREAVDDLVHGRAVRVPEATPFGCSIVW